MNNDAWFHLVVVDETHVKLKNGQKDVVSVVMPHLYGKGYLFEAEDDGSLVIEADTKKLVREITDWLLS